MTTKQTWFTTSGMTGLTLPGMIEEPACTAGRLISPKPGARPGREQAKVVADLRELDRDPLQHAREQARTRPCPSVASTRFGAGIIGSPAIARQLARPQARRSAGRR